MGANGKRRPPRPQIEVLTGGASESETAAIAAALEQFLEETAPGPAGGAAINRWQRAALEEGVSARDIGANRWGMGLPGHPRSG
jgi:hypothetical protein